MTKSESWDFKYDTGSFPSMVIVALTNVCNLNCIYCSQRKINIKGSPDFLSWDILHKLLKEIRRHGTKFLKFTGDGEPLMHPDVTEMLSYAKSRSGTVVGITTNGVLLNREMSRELMATRIDFVDISVGACDAQTYYKKKRKDLYSVVYDNVQYIAGLSRNDGPKIMVNIVLSDVNSIEGVRFRQMWAHSVDRILIKGQHSMSGDGIPIRIQQIPPRYPCPQLWKRIYLSSRGELKYCCNDLGQKTVIANYHDNNVTIESIWNSERYRQLRQEHVTGSFEVANPCRRCRDWLLQEWEYGYETAVEAVCGPNWQNG